MHVTDQLPGGNQHLNHGLSTLAVLVNWVQSCFFLSEMKPCSYSSYSLPCVLKMPGTHEN